MSEGTEEADVQESRNILEIWIGSKRSKSSPQSIGNSQVHKMSQPRLNGVENYLSPK